MEEKIYKSRRLGMPVLILVLALYGAAIFYVASVAISGGNDHSPLFILSILWMCLGWMLFMGLRVIRPQEAAVLTLFGPIKPRICEGMPNNKKTGQVVMKQQTCPVSY